MAARGLRPRGRPQGGGAWEDRVPGELSIDNGGEAPVLLHGPRVAGARRVVQAPGIHAGRRLAASGSHGTSDDLFGMEPQSRAVSLSLCLSLSHSLTHSLLYNESLP